eukprot:CAMPEP_0198201344 /NCGR_PEP_ID=MMETSP1445-20131203/4107_1 /TAXON_ID=36898 /ORGANISM="Pyramimonas sp., Strain CCMP2087" /LENGTH=48 /DNA_ID= /DNA_START= /DNA_END= /DNA_ORIENTATION=
MRVALPFTAASPWITSVASRRTNMDPIDWQIAPTMGSLAMPELATKPG